VGPGAGDTNEPREGAAVGPTSRPVQDRATPRRRRRRRRHRPRAHWDAAAALLLCRSVLRLPYDMSPHIASQAQGPRTGTKVATETSIPHRLRLRIVSGSSKMLQERALPFEHDGGFRSIVLRVGTSNTAALSAVRLCLYTVLVDDDSAWHEERATETRERSGRSQSPPTQLQTQAIYAAYCTIYDACSCTPHASEASFRAS
jgi:hypothetical protein